MKSSIGEQIYLFHNLLANYSDIIDLDFVLKI
jgi:hypothetical protein